VCWVVEPEERSEPNRKRYYAKVPAHVWRGGQLAPDEVGLSLPTLDAAKRRAESMASSIIGQSEGAPGILSSWDIEVTDHRGRTVLIVPINDLQQNMERKQAA
jgi:hypothetical protein